MTGDSRHNDEAWLGAHASLIRGTPHEIDWQHARAGTAPGANAERDAAREQLSQTDHVMQPRHEPIDVRRRRLGLAIKELAADLVEERRRRVLLEREVRDLRARVALYEATNPKEDHECHPVT